MKAGYLVTIIALSIAGCGNQSTETAAQAVSGEQTTTQQAPAPAPTADPHAGVPGYQAAANNTQPQILAGSQGRVNFVQQTGNYTYAEVVTEQGPVWIAANRSAIEVGQQVRWGQGAIMRNFHSKALDRTFPEIMFISSFITQDGSGGGVQGEVISASESAGYSYLEVATERGNVWLALPTMRIEKGDRIRWIGGSEMQNFHSKSLGRTFDSIWFISSAEKLNQTG